VLSIESIILALMDVQWLPRTWPGEDREEVRSWEEKAAGVKIKRLVGSMRGEGGAKRGMLG